MSNTLVDPVDLADFPGAPFPESVVDAAAASIRRTVGWHIAPERTETLTVDGRGGTVLLLPTLKIQEITEVRDISGDTPAVLDDWRLRSGGMLVRDEGWPVGLGAVEVDLSHGYDETPPDLLPAIAERSRAAQSDSLVSQTSLGAFSETYREGRDSPATTAVVHQFRVSLGFA